MNKAMKALFKLKHLFYGSNLNPNVCLHLFDQLIKPICLYGAEIWGPAELHAPPSLENNGHFEANYKKQNLSVKNLICPLLNIFLECTKNHKILRLWVNWEELQ